MRPRRQVISALVVTWLSLPLFTACGGDGTTPDDVTSPQDKLIGTWNCTSYKMTESGVNTELADDPSFYYVVTFDNDGTYTTSRYILGDVNQSGTYSATGTQITFHTGGFEATVDYSLSGDVMTMTGSEHGIYHEITLVRA